MTRNVLAIDIGSTKICSVVAEIGNDGDVKVIGSGIVRSQGIKKGSITNIELASKAIKASLADAKRIAGTEIKRAIVSISGAYTKSLNSSGIVNIPNREITFKEISRVMHTSLYNANIPNEYEVLHTLPFNFIVDDQEYIEDPLGMNASRLEVETHIITTQKSNLNNLRKAVRGAGIEVDTVVLSGYASAVAVLNDDEKELGAAVIDMGGHTCDIVVHTGNALHYNDFLVVGSHHITGDLSMALHTPLNVAETVKITYGSIGEPQNEMIELPMIGDEETTHEVSLGVVHNVIYARVEETLMILAQSLEKSGLKAQLGAGVVLTGGFTKLDGIRELASAIFDNMPVRLARPADTEGLYDEMKTPIHATVMGLIRYAAGGFAPYEIDVNRQVRTRNEMAVEKPVLQEPSVQAPVEPAMTPPPSDEARPTKITTFDRHPDEGKKADLGTKFWNWITQLF